MAEQECVSANQLIALAVAEKLSVWMTADYLQERGAKASRSRFLRVLRKAENQEPDPKDLRS
jgi:hypothetical protein